MCIDTTLSILSFDYFCVSIQTQPIRIDTKYEYFPTYRPSLEAGTGLEGWDLVGLGSKILSLLIMIQVLEVGHTLPGLIERNILSIGVKLFLFLVHARTW